MNPSHACTTRAKMTRMRLAALLLPVALLTGCASTQAAATEPAHKATATKSLDELFIIGAGDAATTALGKAGLIADAHLICTAFNQGVAWGDVVPAVMDGTKGLLTARQVGAVIASAVIVYCPQHKDALPNQG